jgi:hypothetical protein
VVRSTLPDPMKLMEDYERLLPDFAKKRPMAAIKLTDLLMRIAAAIDRLEALDEEAKEQRESEEQRIRDEITELEKQRDETAAALLTLAREADRAEAQRDADRMKAAPVAVSTLPLDATAPAAREPRPSLWSRIAAWRPAPKAPTAAMPVDAKVVGWTPFPEQEGAELAGPWEMMAVVHRVPLGRAAARSARHRWPILIRLGRGLALAACGSAFGLTCGVLTGLVEPKMIAIAPENAVGPVAVVLGLGVALFMAIGRGVFLLSALASEERYEAMLLGASRDARSEAAAKGETRQDLTPEWLARSAKAAFITLLAVVVFLLIIESTCERYGVGRLIMEGVQNHHLVAGAADSVSTPGMFALLCLSLTVSAPFLLLEGAEGWIESREHTICDFHERHRLANAHECAKQLWEGRVRKEEEAQAERSAASSGDTVKAEPQAAEVVPAPPATEATPKPTETPAPLPVAVPEPEAPIVPVVETTPHPANQMAQLKAEIADIDQRLKVLNEQELPEAKSLLAAELADARGDCLWATHLFDVEFERERKSLDDEERPGAVRKVWRRIAGYQRPLEARE